jgi:hypothetical protein
MTRPDGGFLLWVQLPNALNGQDVYRAALAARVAVVPGEVCSSTGRFRNCPRLSCALPWSDRVKHAVQGVGRICHELNARATEPPEGRGSVTPSDVLFLGAGMFKAGIRGNFTRHSLTADGGWGVE